MKNIPINYIYCFTATHQQIFLLRFVLQNPQSIIIITATKKTQAFLTQLLEYHHLNRANIAILQQSSLNPVNSKTIVIYHLVPETLSLSKVINNYPNCNLHLLTNKEIKKIKGIDLKQSKIVPDADELHKIKYWQAQVRSQAKKYRLAESLILTQAQVRILSLIEINDKQDFYKIPGLGSGWYQQWSDIIWQLKEKYDHQATYQRLQRN